MAHAGYGRCWWARPLAAEGPSQEAQQHRADCAHSLELRAMLPTLLGAALSPEHGSAAATLEGVHVHSWSSFLAKRTLSWCLPLPAEKIEWHVLLMATGR